MPIYDTDLWRYFKEKDANSESVPTPTRYDLFENILEGVLHIQKSKMKHLDLKPSNVLIKLDQNGDFDGTNCVITDFGIGGKTDEQTGLAGTPGYASPEQLIGFAGKMSDNYSLGRLMIFLFSDWPTSWTVMYKPVTDQDMAGLTMPPVYRNLHQIITNLLQVILNILKYFKNL